MYTQIYYLIFEICNYDFLYLITYFQKYGVYDNADTPTRDNVVKFFNSNIWWNALSYKKQTTIYSELKNILSYFRAKHGFDRNFTRASIQKKINDYNLIIADLKNKSFDYKKILSSLDPTQNISQFENYTSQWAEVQDKIKFLSSEVKKFKTQL